MFNDIDNDEYGNKLDPQWCYIQFLLRLDLPLDPEIYTAIDVFPPVGGAHSDMRLTNGADRVLHCVISNSPLAGGQSSVAIAFSTYLKDGDGVLTISEVRVNIVDQSEFVRA
jgi:hypothetical protein